MDFLKKPIFLVILAAALIIAGIWAYISNRNQQRATEQKATEQQQAASKQAAESIVDLTNISNTTVSDSVTNQIATADSNATAADKNYQLVAIDIQLPSTLGQGSGTSNYVYSLAADKTYNWVISISNSSETFVRSKVYKDDYLGSLSAVNRPFMKLNYVKALQTAEKNGGLDFRNDGSVSEVRLVLKNGTPKGWLYWYVTYTSKEKTKTFQIDANSGSLVDSGSE